jgi:hypothetical protein
MFANKETGDIDPTVVRTVKAMIKVLRRQGHQVFSAHELEQWGKATKGLTIPQIMKRDFAAINAAEYVFILPNWNGEYSMGTAMLEMGPIGARLDALDPKYRRTRTGERLIPPKGIIYLHHKGAKEEAYFKYIITKLRAAHPKHFEYLEFEKPSDLVRIVRERAPPISKTRKTLGKLRLAASRAILKGRNVRFPGGAKYFTSKPRRRPI